MKTSFTSLVSLCTLLTLTLPLLSCASAPTSAPPIDDDVLIGKPPSAESDPYFSFVAMPADAVEVSHRGMIQQDTSTEETSNENEKPDFEDIAAGEPTQCYSCVKICKVDDASEQCHDAPEDIICGWGSHDDLVEAQKMAAAQCEGMLDMARQMPVYDHISGQCPPASCR